MHCDHASNWVIMLINIILSPRNFWNYALKFNIRNFLGRRKRRGQGGNYSSPFSFERLWTTPSPSNLFPSFLRPFISNALHELIKSDLKEWRLTVLEKRRNFCASQMFKNSGNKNWKLMIFLSFWMPEAETDYFSNVFHWFIQLKVS